MELGEAENVVIQQKMRRVSYLNYVIRVRLLHISMEVNLNVHISAERVLEEKPPWVFLQILDSSRLG